MVNKNVLLSAQGSNFRVFYTSLLIFKVSPVSVHDIKFMDNVIYSDLSEH